MLKHFPGVAGVDEAGRGCLAGPVFAAAVILPEKFCIEGIKDSKLLTAKQRDEMENRIKNEAIWSIATSSAQEIDEYNILQATLRTMENAVKQLSLFPEAIYIDGLHAPRSLLENYTVYTEAKADRNYACVAAASILAKTARDRYMKEMADLYPEYGFEKHYGYGTAYHIHAIEKHGPSPIHRLTFAPIANKKQKCLPYEN